MTISSQYTAIGGMVPKRRSRALATHVPPGNEQTPLVARLNAVLHLGHSLGHGVGDEMDEFLSMYFVDL